MTTSIETGRQRGNLAIISLLVLSAAAIAFSETGAYIAIPLLTIAAVHGIRRLPTPGVTKTEGFPLGTRITGPLAPLRMGHQRPVALTDQEMRRGLVVKGSTGAGKSEAFYRLADGAIGRGGGVVLVDGKGDIASFTKLYAIAARHARTDDFQVFNGMSGEAEFSNEVTDIFDPFGGLDREGLVDLLNRISGHGDTRGRSLLVDYVAAWIIRQRMTGNRSFLPRDVVQAISIAEIVRSSSTGQMWCQDTCSNKAMLYLAHLPDYDERRVSKQPSSTIKEHGSLSAELVATIEALVRMQPAEPSARRFSMMEVLTGRRILCVLHPSLRFHGTDLSERFLDLLDASMASCLSSMSRSPGAWLPEHPILLAFDDISETISRRVLAYGPAHPTIPLAVAVSTYGDYAIEPIRGVSDVVCLSLRNELLASEVLDGDLASYIRSAESGDGVLWDYRGRRHVRIRTVAPVPRDLQLGFLPLIEPETN